MAALPLEQDEVEKNMVTAQQLEIQLRSIAGQTGTLTVSAKDTLTDLKGKIQELWGVIPVQQKLVCGNTLLPDLLPWEFTKTLGELLPSGDVITITVVKRLQEDVAMLLKVEDMERSQRERGFLPEYTVPGPMRGCRDAMIALVPQDWSLAWHHATAEVKADQEFMKAVLLCSRGAAFRVLGPDLQGDKDFVLSVLREALSLKKCCGIGHLAEALRADRDVAWAACRCNLGNVKFLSPELRGDRQVILEVLKAKETDAQKAKELKEDEGGFDFGIIHDFDDCLGFEISCLSEELQRDRELVLTVMRMGGGLSLRHATELQDDDEVVMAAVRRKPYAIQFASPRLQASKEVVRSMIQFTGVHGFYALQCAAAPMRKDRSFILELMRMKGVKDEPGALKSLSIVVKRDENFLLNLLEENPRMYLGVVPTLRKSKDFLLKAVTRNAECLRFAAPRLRQDATLMKEAVKQIPQTAAYVYKRILSDPEFKSKGAARSRRKGPVLAKAKAKSRAKRKALSVGKVTGKGPRKRTATEAEVRKKPSSAAKGKASQAGKRRAELGPSMMRKAKKQRTA